MNMDLHDCEVISIEINQVKKTLLLGLVSPSSKEIRSLTLHGVDRLHVESMSMQNVILDTIIITETCADEYFDFCKKTLMLEENWFILNPGKFIFYIEPSVGLEMCCTFETSEISAV